ncbi:Hypothetical protein PHPALM_4345 [Phytophthora palmivora]|uniref:Transmembrane protein n=1 Tax=Phytophthora palmivora TaxID=4796 RepID=A0A2P4YK91_9STRA|nr:Hypothetical protein PHPALM_4345 [Phytophthora palmivora]
MPGHRFFNSVVDAWELAQVELHGQVSTERINKLRLFLEQASLAKVLAVCFTLPLSCLLVLIGLEAIPLASPNAGTLANYAFWFRHISTLAVLTPGILSNFRSSLPELNISRNDMVVLSAAGSVLSGASAFAVSLLIGFPVPFTLLVSAPVWFFVIVPPTVSIYKSRLRHDPVLLRRFIRCWFIVVWFAVSVVLYPIYIFGFHHLSSVGQFFYVGLLPVLKMTGRNVISWLVGDRYDVKAEIVIFNVEVFSALYMSVAMQNSAKLSTTLAVMAVDIVQSKVAISDINKMMRGIEQICLSSGSRRSSNFCHIIFNPDCQLTTTTPSQQLQKTQASSSRKPSSVVPTAMTTSLILNKLPHSKRNSQIQPTLSPPVDALKHVRTSNNNSETLPAQASNAKRLKLVARKKPKSNTLPKRKQLAEKSARVLFTAEFVLLVKYVEAITPAIYAAFVGIAFSLSNRKYYNQFDAITSDNLDNTIMNVLLYCLLKTLSFCVLCFTLSRRLGISAIHLVTFVLINQWEAVLSKILTWVVYTTLTSLKHSGTGYLQCTNKLQCNLNVAIART